MATKKQKKTILLLAGVGMVAFLGYRLFTFSPPLQEEVVVVEPETLEELVEEEEKDIPPLVVTRTVIVAPTALAKGTLVNDTTFTFEAVPESDVKSTYMTDRDYSLVALRGSIVLRDLPIGTYLQRSDVHIPREDGSPLKAFIQKGMSAINVPLEPYALLGGTLIPGDRVDVIVTYSGGARITGSAVQTGGRQIGSALPSSRTLLRRVRILSIGNQSLAGPSEQQVSGEGQVTATLEVTPRQAELLSVSSRLGQINLVLHQDDKDGIPRVDSKGVFGEELLSISPRVTRGQGRSGR
ncbi:MAG: Flp pilus assembly protein CpaB [Alphaproteobacteria bacterium GM202ARS2]|nr:Flp pilus assembly protein CpaB [Alphaproteobacteria bacterium GM202ARS2]